jgi:hypothetical protein
VAHEAGAGTFDLVSQNVQAQRKSTALFFHTVASYWERRNQPICCWCISTT